MRPGQKVKTNRRQAKCPLQCVRIGQAWCSQYTEDKRAQQDQSSYLSISCSHSNMRHMFALTIQTLCRCSIVKTKPCWRHMLVTIHHTIPQLLTSMYKVFFVQKGSMLAKKDFFVLAEHVNWSATQLCIKVSAFEGFQKLPFDFAINAASSLSQLFDYRHTEAQPNQK